MSLNFRSRETDRTFECSMLLLRLFLRDFDLFFDLRRVLSIAEFILILPLDLAADFEDLNEVKLLTDLSLWCFTFFFGNTLLTDRAFLCLVFCFTFGDLSVCFFPRALWLTVMLKI